MTITDGAIMFVACLLSFAIGYGLALIRLGRHVDKRLLELKEPMQQIVEASRELRTFYTKIEADKTHADEV